MKNLIGAARITVIASAIFIVGGGAWQSFARSQESSEAAFLERCEPVFQAGRDIQNGIEPRPPSDEADRQRLIALTKQCREYLLNGTLP